MASIDEAAAAPMAQSIVDADAQRPPVQDAASVEDEDEDDDCSDEASDSDGDDDAVEATMGHQSALVSSLPEPGIKRRVAAFLDSGEEEDMVSLRCDMWSPVGW